MSNILNDIAKRALRKYHHLIDKRVLKDNRAYKNLHAGKRCFVIGNGPSIKDQDVTKLRDEYTFVMNAFCLHKQYDLIHPKFYAIFHSEYLRGNDVSLDFLRNLDKVVHEDTVMILPLKAKRLIEKEGFLKKNKKIYLYVRGFMEKPRRGGIDLIGTVPTPMSVSVACLMAALYMGFDPVYLMGLEHDWLALKPKTDAPHFSDGESKQFLTNDFSESYEQNAWCTYILFRNYRLIKASSKAKIYNLTPESYLDVFPHKKYEDIISTS